LTAFLWSLVSVVAAADLPRSTPEAQGVSSKQVLAFVEALDAVESLNSVMVVRHGHVIAEGWWAPYHPQARHSLYSLSKSFTSTAVGLAVAEGKLSVDDEVVKFFPDDVPANATSNLKAMRVSDLLRMATGHQSEPPRKNDETWTHTFLAHPVPFKPGTHFLYNTSATYMQSAIVQKVTGQNLLDYLRPRLFEPLGIENPTWEMSPQGIATGGYGLSVRTEDIAKFGQLYLQKGKWNGKQLVPAAWIEAATARQTSNGSNPASDWDQGYGYQFWRCRHGAYRGDGAFGQYCVMLPEQDAVIAITSGVRDMQGILNIAWDKLLPAFGSSPLSADAAAHTALQAKLKGLVVRLPEHAGAPPANVFKKIVFPANDQKVESATFETDAKTGAVTLVMRAAGEDRRIALGQGKWQSSEVAWGFLPKQPVAAAGGWSGNTYTVKLVFYETPFIVTARFRFEPDHVVYEHESNVGFGPTKQPPLKGEQP